jgi:hypothetical protein
MQRDEVLAFLKVVDDELAKDAKPGERLDMHLIGRTALIVRYSLNLGTQDVDIVTRSEPLELEEKAFALFGKETPNAARLGLYLEWVPPGMPPIPPGYFKRSKEVPGNWKVLRPKAPEPHDLAVTKLKRFHAKDREDLQILCDLGEITAAELQNALDLAYALAADEEEDPGRKRAYANLRVVLEYLDGKRRTL